MNRIAALSAALSVAVACGSGVPTAPSGPSPEARLALTCSVPTLLAGEIVVCKATMGSMNVGVSRSAVWTSTDPNVATSLGVGLFMGKSDGQATLTATYSGQSLSAPLTVPAHGFARRRQVPHLDHVHAAAGYDACLPEGSPSDRFDDIGGGAGRRTCAVFDGDAVGTVQNIRPKPKAESQEPARHEAQPDVTQP